MGADRQHACSATSFEPFPDSALERSIVDRFAEQVAKHRDCIALVDGHLRVTYGELDRRANGVAASIVERAGLGRDPVALVARQGAGYATAVLGTLKSGRPYVPLDPADPAPRLQQLIAECGAVAVVTEAESRPAAEEAAGRAHLVVTEEVEERDAGPALQIRPDSLAYIFFTSGSTGVPKGVFDNHRNVLHNILRYTNALRISPADRLTLVQGPAFSGCVSSQLGALLNGAASFPFRLSDEGLVRAAEWLRREGITIYHSVPSIFRAVVRQGGDFSTVRVVRLEGDRASVEDVELWRRHFAPDSLLANGLGTTETGLARQLLLTGSDSTTGGSLPVGYPVRDVEVQLIDEHGAPVPNGTVGEIAVASPYLALGYWNQPDLTEHRFPIRDGARMYLTGDLGRLADDGCLEYLGRRDGDVKILGTRVEPAEVEQELLRVHGIREAAVTVRETSRGEGQLIAYVVAGNAEPPDLHSLRASLAERLPSAMLPSALVELDALPIGVNGKVDRRALPDPEVPFMATEAPGGAQERWLAAIWSDVLELESVGRDDNFFALGGDSLAAAEIVARVEVETGSALPLGVLVRSPTVALLAQELDAGYDPRGSSLTILTEGRSQTPLVLLHGNTGNALHYARLAARADDRRALWALEYLDPEADLGVEAITSAHLETLSRAQPAGPYLLAGFCYGAIIAHELGRRLTLAGHDVRLALLGFTPLEFPSVAGNEAYVSWWQTYAPEARLRARIAYHTRAARQLGLRGASTYLARRARNMATRVWSRGRQGQASPSPSPAHAFQEALASHRPQPFPGRPLVVLHRVDSALYTDDPEATWAGLATGGLELVMLPGANHAMLEDPGVSALGAALDAWAASAGDDPL